MTQPTISDDRLDRIEQKLDHLPTEDFKFVNG